MCGVYIIMNQKNSTELNWLDKLLKLFINKKGFIEFDEWCRLYIMLTKTIENDILIVSKIDTCPICGSKLYRDGTDTFKINNTFTT